MTTETRQPVKCHSCNDKGYLLWVYPERKPRPAYWFSRGPNGERPRECDCSDNEQPQPSPRASPAGTTDARSQSATSPDRNSYGPRATGFRRTRDDH